MKFSTAIRRALDSDKDCPVCDESGRREELAGVVTGDCEGFCPLATDIRLAMGVWVSRRWEGPDCYQWGKTARRNSQSRAWLAAEEIILCLEAQGD